MKNVILLFCVLFLCGCNDIYQHSYKSGYNNCNPVYTVITNAKVEGGSVYLNFDTDIKKENITQIKQKHRQEARQAIKEFKNRCAL